MHHSSEVTDRQSPQYVQDPESKRKDSVHERISERPKITLLQSSKDRLRRRLKEKVIVFPIYLLSKLETSLIHSATLSDFRSSWLIFTGIIDVM